MGIALILGSVADPALGETGVSAPAADVVRFETTKTGPAASNESAGRKTPAGRRVSIGAGNSLPINPVRTQPNGQFCSMGAPLVIGRYLSLGTIPSCPAAPGGPAARPPPTPLEAAYQAWYAEVVLPDPTLATNPTRAVTGLDTFLVIGGPKTVTWSGTALGQQVRLDVESTYDIDWGDPRPDETKANGKARIKGTTSQGGPYPNGDLRHQYIERGSATIQVTQRWTAHWSVGGESGTLADRLLTSSTLVLPIEEIQAIITG